MSPASPQRADKRGRLATAFGAALAAIGAAATLVVGSAASTSAATPLALAGLLGALAIGLSLLSARIERRAETAMAPFWTRKKPAFFAALAMCPILVLTLGAALTVVEGIGVFLLMSLLFGLPAYLLVGGPLAWVALQRGFGGPLAGLVVGFVANLAAAPLTVLGFFVLEPAGYGEGSLQTSVEIAAFIHGFGLVFGPLYGGLMGLLFDGYFGRSARRRLGRPAPRQKPKL